MYRKQQRNSRSFLASRTKQVLNKEPPAKIGGRFFDKLTRSSYARPCFACKVLGLAASITDLHIIHFFQKTLFLVHIHNHKSCRAFFPLPSKYDLLFSCK